MAHEADIDTLERQHLGAGVTVRRATFNDLPQYRAVAREFVAALPITPIVGISDEGIDNFLVRAIDNPDIGVWLAERDGDIIGICGALVYPIYFNPQHTIAQELWWWLTPAARGGSAAKKLLRTIEDWAAEKGASALSMIALDNQNGERVGNFYLRSGFAPMERTYVREVP
jgi:GNAT superfamily N-acetyltransferase